MATTKGKVHISMRISTFFYCLGQGFRNLARNKWFALASIATITACLFMVGVLYAIVLNFRHVVQSIEEGVSVTVFFVEGTTEDQILTGEQSVAAGDIGGAGEVYILCNKSCTVDEFIRLLAQVCGN